jgi:ADP-ribose pyrophosphatase YjhB (NUDIX family)
VDHWYFCRAGHLHWGPIGGAGILFRSVRDGVPTYLLQQRSKSVDYAGTWGIPGGAIREGESAQAAARREVEEELGVSPEFHVAAMVVQDCGGGWTFHVIVADINALFPAYCVRETDATGWFTFAEMRSLSLHPGLRGCLEQINRRGSGS